LRPQGCHADPKGFGHGNGLLHIPDQWVAVDEIQVKHNHVQASSQPDQHLQADN
jgi:hypothetical protein